MGPVFDYASPLTIVMGPPDQAWIIKLNIIQKREVKLLVMLLAILKR